MKKHTLHVVPNLDVARVSWASGFCMSAHKGGAEITHPSDVPQDAPRLYIGDAIDWAVTRPDSMGYFLAAVDGTAQERDNVAHAGITFTPSAADMERARHLLGASRVASEGFPVDFDELDPIAGQVGRRDCIVGFVGRTDSDKGMDVELGLVERLSALGVAAVHLSSGTNKIGGSLHQRGVEVADRLTRPEYLRRLARLGCVINTSPRESLFVSGIEASRMGVPVLAPLVAESGIADWNLPDRFYNPSNLAEAAAMVLEILGKSDVPDVSGYSANRYVQRVTQQIEMTREGAVS